MAGFVWPKKNERRRLRQRGIGRLVGSYDRGVFVCATGGDVLAPAILGAPKIRTPTPINNNNVSSVTETTAKL